MLKWAVLANPPCQSLLRLYRLLVLPGGIGKTERLIMTLREKTTMQFRPITLSKHLFCIAIACIVLLGCANEAPQDNASGPSTVNALNENQENRQAGQTMGSTPKSGENSPDETPLEDPPDEQPIDNENALKALTKAGVEFKVDGDGLIIEANLRDMEVDAKLLAHLTKLPRLRSVLLNASNVQDEQLKELGNIATLQNLDLRNNNVTTAGVAHLVGLKNLKALRLSGNEDVDDDSLKTMAQLSNLKALMLDGCWISADGLKHLKSLTKLEELYLAGTLADEEAAEVLAGLPGLKKLRVAQCSIPDAGIEKLGQITTLTELDLSENTLMTDAGVAHLANLTNLTRLNLWRCVIGNEGVAHLAGLNRMQWLNIDNTHLSDDGLIHLKDMKELSFLHLGSTKVTDKGMPVLESLTSLKNLIVTRTGVTQAGVDALKAKLPDCKIQLAYVPGE